MFDSRAQQVFLGSDGEILAAVTRDQLRLDGGDDARRRHAVVIRQVDFHHAVAVEQRDRARGGDVGGGVEVDAEKLSLRLEHADDAEVIAADQHDERARIGRIVGRQKLAGLDLDAAHLQHGGADAIDGSAAQAVVALDFGVAPHRGRDCRYVRQAGNGARVVQRDRVHRTGNAGRRRSRGLDFSHRDADDVGAELSEFGQHETVDALVGRRQQDHRGDAEHGQQAAHALRDERAHGEVDGVGQQHA